MTPTLLILALFTYCSGVTSQTTLTQPASASVSPRETAKLSCTASDTSYNIGWYQQRHGEGPRYVHHPGYSRGQGIPDRFTASQSGSTGYLTIANVQAGDEADYICGRWQKGGSTWIFGGGTELAVLSQPTAPPTVNLYPPSPEELKSSDKATLVCLASGFYPRSIEVDWEADGTPISSGVETTTPTKLDDKYAVSSYLSMNKSDLESTYTCKVKHEGKTFKKEVNLA